MRWKNVIVDYLMQKQRGKCSLCAKPLTREHPGDVEPVGGGGKRAKLLIDQFHMVHEQCDPSKTKQQTREERLEEVARLLDQGTPPRETARRVGISMRTFYRYIDALFHPEAECHAEKMTGS